jgi:hypothetical protein
MRVIGDKDVFALEYEVVVENPVLMVNHCLWVQGKFFGNPEDSGMLYTTYMSLKSAVEGW